VSTLAAEFLGRLADYLKKDSAAWNRALKTYCEVEAKVCSFRSSAVDGSSVAPILPMFILGFLVLCCIIMHRTVSAVEWHVVPSATDVFLVQIPGARSTE
jgi:hypothetical protein